MTVVLAAVALISVVMFLDILFGLGRLAQLGELPVESRTRAPVSIIVPARDEARGIETAARSLLAIRHRPLEIIAVDDRSSDGTGAILDRLAAEDSRLQVIHLGELPPGWLGKNHAVARGAERASGEWLLFTDADVVFEPSVIGRALGYCETHRLDHLTALPEIHAKGFWLQAFVTGFAVWGLMAGRPWRVRHPSSRRALGVGAFNLVRASVYRRAGGHERIRLRPDDDLKLARLIRREGGRSDVVRGRGFVTVEWYPSLREAIDGLMKNSFAVTGYRPLLTLAGALLGLAMALGPAAGILFGTGAGKMLGATALLAQLGAAGIVSRNIPMPLRSALFFPVSCLLLCWVILRAMTRTLLEGGIWWRGTFYPLAELKKQ